MEAADPRRKPEPADATHAAPISDIEAEDTCALAPFFMSSRMLIIAVFPIIPDGIPVRGGDGAINVPLGDLRGFDI